MGRIFLLTLLGAIGASNLLPAVGAEEATPAKTEDMVWHTDYTEAMKEAEQKRRMLFIFFHEKGANSVRDAFNARCLTPAMLAPWRDRYVWASLPVDTAITLQGKPVRVLHHAAFGHMQRRQGISIVDFENTDQHLYGRVVSAFPFSSGYTYTASSLKVILGLPRGTITQRTMIYAVRIHPEAPASTRGQLHPVLSSEAQSHSHHQASIGVQGHHSWESRFHRINGRLSGLTSQEVVAESWPNEDLVTACIDCVHSWRQSSGHWSAVQGNQRAFGYDIKLGGNGIWYATGLFAR